MNRKWKMSMLLRRVWETMSSRTCSTGDSSARPSCTTESSSLGAFDQIPWDVLIQIVKLIGPKEAAKLCVVSKSWRALVSDNRLWIFFLQHQQEPWDSIFFGETTLGSGYPYQWVNYCGNSVWLLRKWMKLKIVKFSLFEVLLGEIVYSAKG